jgi:phage tail sheath gpL-like
MPDVLYKLQPDRTMYLRGFDHLGAGAAMHNARPDGFELTGVFRDASDFAVLVVWDADDFFNHPTLKYLPDTNFNGLALRFDATYQNLMPLNCTKYATVDWPHLDMQFSDGTSKQVRLSDYAQAVANPDAPASGTFEIVGSDIQAGDRLTIWYLNISYDYTVPDTTHATLQFYIDAPNATYTVSIGGSSYSYTLQDGDTADSLVQNLIAAINADSGTTGVAASAGGGAGQVSLTLLKDPGDGVAVSATGNGAVNLHVVQASSVASELAAQINSVNYDAVKAPFGLTATVDGAKLTITTTSGGYDANFVRLLAVNTTDRLKTSQTLLQLSGGASTATLRVNYDFSASLGEEQAEQIRKMWMTFAPRLADAQAFVSSEWHAAFDNWTVTGPEATRQLRVPGPRSYWIGATDSGCQFEGAWSLVDGFYLGGQGRSGQTGARVTIQYTSAFQHDVWLATEANSSGGVVNAALDAGAATASAVTAGNGDAVTVRKLLFAQLPAGHHTVTLAVASGTLLFDHLIVCVPTTDTPSLTAQTDLSAALDYSTDHCYKLPPARILWLFQKLGLMGPVNQYIGVFWWNQRKCVGGAVSSAEVSFAGGFAASDQIFLSIGGQVCGKTIRAGDTPQSIVQHFANFINAIYVGVWAEADGSVLRLHNRSSAQAYRYTLEAWVNDSSSPTQAVTANASLGAALVRLSGDFVAGDRLVLNAGGQLCTVTVAASDTVDTIAQALASAVNVNANGSAVLGALAASAAGTSVTIQNVTTDPLNSCSLSISVTQAAGSTGMATLNGSLQIGAAGTWQVDPAQDPPLNAGARAWHGDFYRLCAAAGLEVTTSSSMELVNPPDGFAAQFADGEPVTTDVGFANLHSTHCAFSSPMLSYHTRVYTWLAQAMAAVGFSPVLQCGEFTWWYFAHPAPSAEFAFYASGNGRSHFITVNGVTYTHVENNPNGESSADVANALIAAVNAGPDTYVGASIGSAPYVALLTPRAATDTPISISSDNGSTTLLYTGGMAYYDSETAAAALAALGRPLASFLTPTDDPGVHASADATFLRNRLCDYCGSLSAAVKAAVPGARFEILFPDDVNYPEPAGIHSLGGRLNRFVNLPPEWSQPSDSGFDRFKLEELDFGAWNKDLNLVRLCQKLPAALGWPMERVSCITPVFRPGYAWMKEVATARELHYRAITLWAFDHVNLAGLDVVAPGSRQSQLVG